MKKANRIATAGMFLIAIIYGSMSFFIDSLVSYLKNYELNFFALIIILVIFLIVEILLVGNKNRNIPFFEGFKYSILNFAHSYIYHTRLMIVIAMLLALFAFHNKAILINNDYVNFIAINLISAFLVIFTVMIIFFGTLDLDRGPTNIGTVVEPFRESVTMVSVAYIFMMFHTNLIIVYIAFYAIVIAIYLNLHWLIQGLIRKKNKLDDAKYYYSYLIRQAFLVIFVTLISYYLVPAIKGIAYDVKKTFDLMLDESEYKKDYYFIQDNLKSIERNLLILKKETVYTQNNVKLIDKNFAKCFDSTEKIKKDVTEFYHSPTIGIYSKLNNIQMDYIGLKKNYIELKKSIHLVKHGESFKNMQMSFKNIDSSINVIDEKFRKIRSNMSEDINISASKK